MEGQDHYVMRERAADMRDVTKRVLTHLLGADLQDLTAIHEEVILLAEDLTPSNTAQLNRSFVKASERTLEGASLIPPLWRVLWKFRLLSERRESWSRYKMAIY